MFNGKKYIRGHAVDHRQGDDLTSVQAMVDFMIFFASTHKIRKGSVQLFISVEEKHNTQKPHNTQWGWSESPRRNRNNCESSDKVSFVRFLAE